jgi:hypothetical protein
MLRSLIVVSAPPHRAGEAAALAGDEHLLGLREIVSGQARVNINPLALDLHGGAYLIQDGS